MVVRKKIYWTGNQDSTISILLSAVNKLYALGHHFTHVFGVFI